MFTVKRTGDETRVLTYKDDNCVACGICTNVCPTTSLRLGPVVPIARGLIEMDYLSINSNTCVLCGLCSIACPFDSLSLTLDGEEIKELENYPKWDVESSINEDECMFCGRCYSVCPNDAILYERSLPSRNDLVRGEISINEEKCIYCGFCDDICPAGAISVDANIKGDNCNIKLDESKCVYCKLCARVCPEEAIKAVCTICMEADNIKIPSIKGNVFIVGDDCVYCSWCKEICPVDAVTITKPFEGSLSLVETDDAQCKGESCHACQDVCPCNAVTIEDNKSVTNSTFCNLCGACVTACPQNIRELKRTSMKLTNINSEAWKDSLNNLIGK